jgi:hypothetical protein
MENTNKHKPAPLSFTARYFKVSTSWLRQQADEGKLPHVKAGDQYLFDLDIINDILLKRAKGVSDES